MFLPVPNHASKHYTEAAAPEYSGFISHSLEYTDTTAPATPCLYSEISTMLLWSELCDVLWEIQAIQLSLW